MENKHKMKNTPIGLIPEGWSARPLGDLCEIHGRIGFRGYTKADLVRKGEGAITFSPSDIDNQRISYKDCDYISWAKYTESPEIQVKEGDILFCKTASIGKCAQIWDLKEKATINPQFVLLNDFKCNSSLLYYMLAFSSFQNRVLVITGGSTIPTISQEAMKKQLIPIPDNPEEQKRIADTLLSIDKILGALDEAIAKKRQIKEGLMQQLLTGILRVDGHRSELVQSDIGLIPKEWKLAKLNDFIEDINDGPFGSNLKREHYTLDREVRIVQLGNVGEDGWNDDNVKYTTYDHAKTLKRCIIPYGSVIITKMMPAGRAIICPNKDPMYIQGSDVIKLKFTSEIDNQFFVYYTKTRFYQEQIDSSLQGSTRARTNISKIKNIVIPLPAIEEQKRIVSIISRADAEILSLESHKAKYRLIKQGMMQDLLTGKTRL